MSDDIDYVFPFVIPTDPVWQKDYTAACKKAGKYVSNNSERFRDWGLLKYVFRSIDMNMPWIRTIHVLVHSKSQIPEWLNSEKVHVVEHKDFIPEKYLPTFNSTAIEMFLCNIPDLSEKFIYGNDDFFAIGKLETTDFYTDDGTPVITILKKDKVKNPFQRSIKNTFDLIRTDYPETKLKIDNENCYYRPRHFMNAFLKSSCINVYNKHKNEIEKSITTFREGRFNYNQYLYYYDLLLSGNYIESKAKGQYISLDYWTDTNKIKLDNDTKFLCLNDTETARFSQRGFFDRLLNKKFPNKCKYEN